MLGAGGLFVVAFSAYFGRFPVLFWFIVIALGTAIWCAAAQSFESFMVIHIFSTLGNTFNMIRNRLLAFSTGSFLPSRKGYVNYLSRPSTNILDRPTLTETGRSHVYKGYVLLS